MIEMRVASRIIGFQNKHKEKFPVGELYMYGKNCDPCFNYIKIRIGDYSKIQTSRFKIRISLQLNQEGTSFYTKNVERRTAQAFTSSALFSNEIDSIFDSGEVKKILTPESFEIFKNWIEEVLAIAEI